jgi:hypothetical protein
LQTTGKLNLINTEQQISTASQTFALRKLMQTQLLESQKAEHDFYENLKVKVETAAKQLTELLSKLLQNDLESWPHGYISDFCFRSAISPVEIDQWKLSIQLLRTSQNSLVDAQEVKRKAKTTQSKYSSVLWGAKSGAESQYAEASKCLNIAEAEETRLSNKAKLAQTNAVIIGTKHLRQCVSRAPELSQSPYFGQEIAKIIKTAGGNAATALIEHKRSQIAQLNQIQVNLQRLTSIHKGI